MEANSRKPLKSVYLRGGGKTSQQPDEKEKGVASPSWPPSCHLPARVPHTGPPRNKAGGRFQPLLSHSLFIGGIHPLHMHSAHCCVQSGPSSRIDMVMKSWAAR